MIVIFSLDIHFFQKHVTNPHFSISTIFSMILTFDFHHYFSFRCDLGGWYGKGLRKAYYDQVDSKLSNHLPVHFVYMVELTC